MLVQSIRALVVLLALAVIGFSGCSPAAPEQQEFPPPTVTAATPVQKRVIEYTTYTGRLEAVESVEVRPRVSGHIESVEFTEGEKVKKDDLLYLIDPRPLQAEVNRLNANVAQNEAAVALAQTNLKRAETLIKNSSISQEEIDIRNSQAAQAEANLQSAKAALAAAELRLSFTEVRAPIDGIADRHFVTAGNLVNGQETNATLLTTIVQHDPIFAYFEVDERSFLKNVRLYFAGELPGRGNGRIPVEMALDDEKGYPHKGEIDFASNQLDPDTASITIRALFDNDSELLTPGMFARVRVPISKERDGLLIPDSAIGTDQVLKFIWVVKEDDTVERKTLELGPKFDGLRIVRSGLEPGDRVVTKGIQFLQPGAQVNVEMESLDTPSEDPLSEPTADNA